MIVKKSYLDYYLECGFSAHFLVLSAILFLSVALIEILPRDKERQPYLGLLLPCSLLPIIIGIFGSSYGLHTALEYMQGPPHEGMTFHPAELVIPLVAGSFLSAVFTFISIFFAYIGQIHRSNKKDGFAEQGAS